MKEIKIVFMGTPDFAVTILDSIAKSNFNVVGVITAPDKPAGRGRKINESAVKKYAVANNLNILQPTNLKDEAFLSELKALDANLQIVVAFRMLPKVVWSMPKLGTFNLHASLLPQYRGAAPINWAIINGEKETGVTTFFIDDKIDTGEIILQKKCDINDTESAGELHDKLMYLGADLVIETVKHIQSDTIKTTKQPDSTTLKSAYKIHKSTCQINWADSIDNIYNHIRGLSPYPGAWTTLKNDIDEISLKIFKVNKLIEDHNFKTGEIISTKKEMKVAVVGGYILLEEIQLPGKRKMKTVDVLNGLNIEKNHYVS